MTSDPSKTAIALPLRRISLGKIVKKMMKKKKKTMKKTALRIRRRMRKKIQIR